MNIFSKIKKEKFPVCSVVDAGGDAIRAVVFQVPSGGTMPRTAEKFVWEAPVSYPMLRLVRKIKKTAGLLTHEKRLARIVIALGPEVAECSIEEWTGQVPRGGYTLMQTDIRALYEDLVAKHHDPRRFVLTSLLGLRINGYPFSWPGVHDDSTGLRRSDIKEIGFRVLALAMPLEAGELFKEMRADHPRIAIDLPALVPVLVEAVVRGLGISDALVIDIRGHATALAVIKQKECAHAAYIPFGADRFAKAVAKASDCTLVEAAHMLRQYGQGMGTAPTRAQIGEAMASAAEEWKKLLTATLETLTAAGPLPAEILLCGPGAALPEVRAALQSGDWFGMFSYAEKPMVRLLDGASFFGGDTLGGRLAGPEDVGLAALMWYTMHHTPLF